MIFLTINYIKLKYIAYFCIVVEHYKVVFYGIKN